MSDQTGLLSTMVSLALTLSTAYAQVVETGLTEPGNGKTDDWFEEDNVAAVPQVGAHELVFLATPPESKTPLSKSRIAITDSSLDDGWVDLEQCYQGLDAVPEAEIVYRYHSMRGLRVISKANIGRAAAEDQSVQLSDVGNDAKLCIRAEVQILYQQPDGNLELRNGPFLRKFLDGYFPLHVTLSIHYPPGLLRHLATSPDPQPGFTVESSPGLVDVDSWFVGTLNINIRFQRAEASPTPAH